MASARKRGGRASGSILFAVLVIFFFVKLVIIDNDRPQVPATRTEPRASSIKIVEGFFGFQSAMGWSPDSRYVVLGTFINGGKTGKILIFNAISGENVLTYHSNTNGIKTVVWSPDGKRIAAGTSERTVQVIDVASGRSTLTFKGNNKTFSDVIQLAWSPDGKYLAESSDRHIQLREPTSGKTIWAIIDNDADHMLWSPDGTMLGISLILNSGVREVQIWNIGTRQKRQTLAGDSSSGRIFAWSPDGKRIARPWAFGVVQVWDVQTGDLVLTHGKNDPGSRGVVRSLAWSPDGKYIASDSIEIWDANTGHTITEYKIANPVHRLLWSPDGKYIMAAEESGTLEIWEAPK